MKLKSIFYSLLIASLTSTAYAQVKIGSNPGTITSTSNLEVESSNGIKVVVDKATGNLGAGVTDPGQSIDAAGTVRLRNIPTNTTNNLILTVDANGVVSKQSAPSALQPVVRGVLASGADLPLSATAVYTGATLTLPANSQYIVSSVILLFTIPKSTDGSAWVRSYFCDSPTSSVRTSDAVGNTTLFSGNAEFSRSFTLLSGSITLKNTSASPKTYYYWGSASPNGGTLPTGAVISAFGSSAQGENQIYAVPFN